MDQTPWPGIDVPEDCDYSGLLNIMRPLGAEMLLRAIRNRLYLPPYKGVGWAEHVPSGERQYRRAPKIATAHRRLCFQTMGSSHILRMSRAFASTWAFAAVSTPMLENRRHRVIFEEPFRVLSPSSGHRGSNGSIREIPPGLPYWPPNRLHDAGELENRPMLVNTVDGETIAVISMKVEGSVTMPAYKAALKHGLIGPPPHVDSKGAITFHEALAAHP